MITIKLRAARQRIRGKTGRCEGRKPYADTAAIQRIAELHGRGMNYTWIAGTLKDQGIKSSEGKAWYPASVSRVVRTYISGQYCEGVQAAAHGSASVAVAAPAALLDMAIEPT